MKLFSQMRRFGVRFAAVFLCLATLADCSGGSLPSTRLASSGVTCFSNIAHQESLPVGAHVDCHGAPTDAFGRPLSYVGGNVPWRAIDHGVGIDPSLPAAPPDTIQKAKRDAALPHNGDPSTGSVRMDSGCTFGTASRTRASISYNCDDGILGAAALTSIEGIPKGKLTILPDGYYYDEHGDQWWYDALHGQWLKTIAIVKSAPSQSEYYPYFVAYDFINGMAPLWWIFGLPVPETGIVPFGTITERFGLTSFAVSEHVLARVLEDIAAEAGADNVLRMEGYEANMMVAPSGFTSPPFMMNYEVTEFTVTESMRGGKIAGKQLVRVAADKDALLNNSPWLTTLDQITRPDGTFMSGSEIADKLALPRVPLVYAYVKKVTPGSKFLAGLAGGVQKWGSGGGVQYYRVSGSYELEDPLKLP